MIIDKDIPIYQIVISGNSVSEYYAEKSVYSFGQLGYNNIQRVEATTPDNYSSMWPPAFLPFKQSREYSAKRSRDWLPEEQAIWYSHYTCWERVDQPSLIIEHDCMLYKEIPDHLSKRNLWSFGMTEDGRNLAALGYYIKPSAAKRLRGIQSISAPVDAWIHRLQPWYEYGRLSKNYIDKNVCAKHYINEEVGTSKPTVGATL